MATIITQHPAGVEVDALVDGEGNIYVPMMQAQAFAATGSTTTEAAPAAPLKKSVTLSPAPKEDEPEESDVMTEEELMALSVDELLAICKKRGIDPKGTPGKNTNKKLRVLILDAQGEVDPEEEEEEEEEAPVAKKAAGKKAAVKEEEEEEEEAAVEPPTAKVIESVAKGLLKGAIDVAEAIEQLGGGVDKAAAKKLTALAADDDTTLADLKGFIESLYEEAEEEEEEEAPKKSSKKAAGKSKAVEIADLEVGDNVSVFWANLDEWYDGEVTKVSPKGTFVTYTEDESTEVLSAKVHTKITRA